MLASRKALSLAVLSLSLVAAAVPSRASAPVPAPGRGPVRHHAVALGSTLPTTIDGKAGAELAALRGDAGMMVAIAPLAARLGIPVARKSGSLAVQINGAWVNVAANDTTVREGDTPTMRLAIMPVQRDGKLFVAVDDLTELLDVDASLHGGRLVIGTKSGSPSANVAVTERAKPSPSPSPTAFPAPKNRFQAPADKHVVGHASLTMNNDANLRSYNALLDGGGSAVRANLYASGTSGAHTSLGGSARIGPGERHLLLGGVDDPLFGSIFVGGGANGVLFADGRGTSVSSSVTGLDDRRVIAVGRRSGSSIREVAFATDASSPGQLLLGLQSWTETSGRYFQREVWVGEHGLGAGLHFRSAGRFFTEEKLGIAGAGLPLVTGDAPTQATLGYDLSGSLGVRAGVGTGHGQRGSGLAQLFAHTKFAQFTVSRYGDQFSTDAVITGTASHETIGYVRGPGLASFDALGDFALRGHGGIEARAYLASQNSRDGSVTYRFDRDGPSASIGLENVASGAQSRFGPILGYAVPVSAALSLGAEIHPLSRGNALRLLVNQTLFAGSRAPQRFVTVERPGDAVGGIVVLIDGVRSHVFTSPSMKIGVPAGTHYVALVSENGSFASPEQRVTDGIPASIALPLWQVAQVHGQLRLATGTVFVGTAPSLGGISVVLAPGNVVVQTDEDGRFSFPSQALDPASKISLDPSSVPTELATPPEQPIGRADQPLEIVLASAKTVERVRF